MSKIMAKLARHPNEKFTFEHNGQIKEFLMAIGIDTCFNQKPPASPTGATVLVVQHIFHATHFIVVQSFSGHDDDKQNGYFVTCLPKSKFGPEVCQEFFRKVSSIGTTGEVLDGGIKWSRKPGDSSN